MNLPQDPFSSWRTERLKKESLARRILGVEEGADFRQVKRAWRRLAREFHPDAGGASWRFMNIHNAWRVLAQGADEPLIDDARPKPRNPRQDERDYFNWWLRRWR